MALHELAGTLAPTALLVNIPRLVSAYYTTKPDVRDPLERVSFGTSGHRGSSLRNSFTENHIIAVCQAISDYRKAQGIAGPLFLGMDTHALSEAAFSTAVEVFAANEVELMIQTDLGYTPTPVISHAILTYNRNRSTGLADGVVITPSHNPPDDGGIKYNTPNGGPADTNVTKVIQDRANQLLENELQGVKRVPLSKALVASTTHFHDYIAPYVADLRNVVNMDAITASTIKIGVDALGGAGASFWAPIVNTYRLNAEVVHTTVDPTFSFMTVDRDGKIRMDCSSPYAMAGLIGMKDHFDIAFGNDPDYDRHGIVTHTGLMNPNHFLAVAVWYLFQNRPHWGQDVAIGKTLVSSSMLDRVAASIGRTLVEVPVGFKWFVDGLFTGTFGFAGEESAGASFLRHDATVWTTDKDGFILDLLAAEITAVTGKDPSEHYRELEAHFGSPVYERIDAAANATQKAILGRLSADMIVAKELAGEPIIAKLTHAPGNNAAIGGLKVVTENGWFAARPSGTEDVYKIYAESFKDTDHLHRIQAEAQQIVAAALGG